MARMSAALVAIAVSSLTLASCKFEPVVVDGQPFPACPATGKTFSAQELMDIVVRDEIKRIDGSQNCIAENTSLKDFHLRNPHCCDIDLDHDRFNYTMVHRVMGADGYLIGDVQVHYLCVNGDVDTGEFERKFADVTSCGVIVGSQTAIDAPRFRGRYPVTRE
jgi:hypothetical protein